MLIDGISNSKVGVYPLSQAKEMAEKDGNTLVCVSQKAKVHVYRIISIVSLQASLGVRVGLIIPLLPLLPFLPFLYLLLILLLFLV